MPDYIIEGNTQAAAQGNSWQDGVNALVMLWKRAIQSMQCCKYALFEELRLWSFGESNDSSPQKL